MSAISAEVQFVESLICVETDEKEVIWCGFKCSFMDFSNGFCFPIVFPTKEKSTHVCA